MNILFFSRLFYPHIGGVEKHVLEISKILIKKGYKIVVITEKYPEDFKPKEKIEGIEVYRMPNLKENWFKKFQIWKWMWENRVLIKNADIIHCHDVFFWYLPFRFFFVRKPIYTTFHGYEDYPLKSKFIIMHKISEKFSLGNICIGHFMKKWYGTKPDYISYGGVNIVKSEKLKVKSSEGAVFIGRLDEQTGIKTYVKAYKLIKKKIPDFKFLVVGDGKFKKNMRKDVRVLGLQKNPEKYFEEYRFAFVSRYLSVLEAMAAKRLVFAVYDNPLKGDYLKMAPFANFINIAKTPNELSTSVLYFLKNHEKEKIMVDNAFKWLQSQTWNKVVQLYIDLWK